MVGDDIVSWYSNDTIYVKALAALTTYIYTNRFQVSDVGGAQKAGKIT